MTKEEKRARANRKNLAEFFSGKDKYGTPRSSGLEAFPPARFIELARLYLERRGELEQVFTYARRFKQATMELTEADLESALLDVQVRSVMES